MTTARMLALGGILGALLLTASSARAQNQGFDINRYQPTPAGEWSFMVDHPWYSKTRFFAAGITLDYAHNPLLYATADRDGQFFTSSAIVAPILSMEIRPGTLATDVCSVTCATPSPSGARTAMPGGR